ncbi:MAG: hypothetical protein PHQ60_00055 [Sideroxydans sp.]|nr:hypothetical protein [Sideroxydans sp.]
MTTLVLQSDVVDIVGAFRNCVEQDKHHRFLSWEHCYDYFGKDEIDSDKACLHMAFYLASWGMYRGSSFLLWKDYLIHKEVVNQLLKKRHLRKVSADYSVTEISEIVELSRWIKDWYRNNSGKINGEVREANATDTLVTKIILGALGCVPAYDRYFIDGLHERGIRPHKPSQDGISELVNFYNDHRAQFDSLQENKTVGENTYPAMKLVDMYFWQIGFERDRKKT